MIDCRLFLPIAKIQMFGICQVKHKFMPSSKSQYSSIHMPIGMGKIKSFTLYWHGTISYVLPGHKWPGQRYNSGNHWYKGRIGLTWFASAHPRPVESRWAILSCSFPTRKIYPQQLKDVTQHGICQTYRNRRNQP